MTAEHTSEITGLRRKADDLDAEAQSLIARHGTGIRPAWVGEDYSILRHRADMARAEANRLEAQATA